MQINQQPDRTFAILAIELGVQAATSGGDTPVDAARIVADCVRAHFFDFEAATTLGAAMAALNLRERRATLAEIQALRGAAQRQQFVQVRQDQGVGTWLRSSSTQARTEERRVGKERGSRSRYRWSQYNKKKNTQ